MKIAIFTDTFFPEINGVSNTLSYLNDYFNKNQICVNFFAPDYEKPTQQTSKLNITRIKGVSLPIAPESRVCFPSYTFMRKTIMDFNPDIIHVTTQLGIGRLGVKYAHEFHIPLLMSYHTNFDQYLKFYQLQRFDHIIWDYTRTFFNKSDLTLCPSQNCVDSLKVKGFQNLGIWSRGVNLRDFSPQFSSMELRRQLDSEEKLIFTYVGRISAEKDIDVYLEAIKIANNKLGEDKINFIFTGLGPYTSILEEANIPNLKLTGAKKGIALSQVYATSDAFIFPSSTETFGNVLLEAMASGLPTLSVNSGGVQDFAKHNVNSYVCQAQNPISIADGIIALAKNKALRDQLAQGALETATDHDWDTIFNGLIDNYHSLIQSQHTMAV